jgi:hypothetical protein
MFKKMLIALTGMMVFAVMPALADAGCKNGKFVGSYTRPNPNVDIFGDGTVLHSYAFQLNLHGDGTATEYWTGYPDYMVTLGTGSESRGSWTCRRDGKLVVTMILAGYTPVEATDFNTGNPTADVSLSFTSKVTYLFTIDNDNTITRVQSRARNYTPAQDPTDPAGGTLGPLRTTSLVYTRLAASDDDLLAP